MPIPLSIRWVRYCALFDFEVIHFAPLLFRFAGEFNPPVYVSVFYGVSEPPRADANISRHYSGVDIMELKVVEGLKKLEFIE